MERKVEMVFTGKKNKRVKANDMKRGEKMKKVAILLAVMGVFFGLSGLVLAYEFVSLDYPGEAYTRAFGINNSGVVVGDYYSDYYHGFVFDGDTYSMLEVPSGYNSYCGGINDSGNIVGDNFVYNASTGTFTTLEVPEALYVYAYDINESGVVAGHFLYGAWGVAHGFVYDGDTYTVLDVPGATETWAYGVNDFGEVVGYYYSDSSGYHGFIFNDGTYTTMDFPEGMGTFAYGINNSGHVVGYYFDYYYGSHGFVFDGDKFTTVDVPDASETWVRGINDSGDIVGFFSAGSDYYGFIANAPPPEGSAPDSTANFLYASTNLDPINTFSGELFSRKPRDFDLGGPMPLYFQRYYASYLRRSSIVGDLGSNWRHNFDARLYRVGNKITYVSNDGRVTDFLKDLGTGVWNQLTNTDTPYQLSVVLGQDVVLYDTEDDRIYTFDFTTSSVIIGKLVRIEDGHGNAHTVTYDLTNGHIETVSDGLGRTLTFYYNSDAIPKISVVSDGTRSVSYQYTDPIDSEYLTLATDGLIGGTEYSYKDTSANADHALMTSMTRPRGNVPYSQTFFDPSTTASGRVAAQTDADGNTFSLDYSGLETTLTDPLGNTRVHTHTGTGEFNNRQDQAGESFSMGSDPTGRRNSLTDRLGDTTTIDYDARNGYISYVLNADGSNISFFYTERLFGEITLYDFTGVSYADGSSESLSYDANGNLTSHTDQNGNTNTATYNARGQSLTTTNAAGGTTVYTYNTDATPASTTDPAGNTTSFGYDGLKRTNLIVFADGNTMGFTYNDHDQLVTETDPNKNTTSLDYDANGNLISITDHLGNSIGYGYDGNDRIVSRTDPMGNIASRSFSPLGKIATITDENSNTTVFDYDILGRLTTTTDPVGNVWSRSYNAEAILSSLTDPLGNTTRFESDSMGRITRTTSPLGNQSSVSYDAMGRIVKTTDAAGNTSTLSRDPGGLLSSVTLDSGPVTASYTRNSLDQITIVTDPGGNDWLRNYDNQGRLTSSNDPLGNTIAVSYDSRNRISLITYPDSLGTLDLDYNPVGNLVRASYLGGPRLNYTYDENYRLTAANGITRSYDANGRINNTNGIAIGRDAGGRIISITLASGKRVTYEYFANDSLKRVVDWIGGATTFDYDDAGRLTETTRPNGVNTTYTWDADSRLTGITEGAVSDITLIRNPIGQITTATRNVPLPGSAAGLTGSNNTYDAASQVSGFDYDPLGRLRDDGDRTYAWDLSSRLTSITQSATTTSFTYDSTGHRLSRTSGGVTVGYVWNYALGLPSISIETRDGANLRYYIHTPGGALLYSIDAVSNARNFYHYDEMGNTIFVTDGGGSVIASYAYTPYGQMIASTGSVNNPFSWQGRYGIMAEGNGLYYVRARYYDANTGRFISRDPIKAIGPREINPYQYALGNPLMFVDVTGRKTQAELHQEISEVLQELAAAQATSDDAIAAHEAAVDAHAAAVAEWRDAAWDAQDAAHDAAVDATLAVVEAARAAAAAQKAYEDAKADAKKNHCKAYRLHLKHVKIKKAIPELEKERDEARENLNGTNTSKKKLRAAEKAYNDAVQELAEFEVEYGL